MAVPVPASYMYEFNPAFDFEITEGYFREYADGLIDACAAIADGGKLKGIGEEADAEGAKAAKWTTWHYSYQGSDYMIMLSGETGYESELTLQAQQVK
jgi:hypothetical protein